MLPSTTSVVGLGVSTQHASLDWETYSEAGFVWRPDLNKWTCLPGAAQGKKGLPIVGAAAYAMHPSTEVLSLSYDLRDGIGKRRWRPGMPAPLDLFIYLARGGLLSGWNVSFEVWIWNYVCVRRYGWPPLDPRQVLDTMAKSRGWCMPGALGDASDVLQLVLGKDPEGMRLIKKLSIPRDPTKKDPRLRIRPEEDPVDGPKLWDYNDRDIEAEAEANSRLPDLDPVQMQSWRDDQAINRRGVMIDLPAVRACIAIINQATDRYVTELEALAGCKPSEVQQLQGWLHAHGVHLDSLDEEHVEEALTRELPPHCRRALEIRKTVGSASVKKVFAMLHQATPAARLHDLYKWHGARTGRPTGEGPQPTNLPKAGPDVHRCGWAFDDQGRDTHDGQGCGRFHGAHTYVCPWCNTLRRPTAAREWSPGAAEDALLVIAAESLLLLQWFFGDAMLTLAGVLRGLFIAPPGHDFVSSDFTAIEGVVIACLAGEQWRIDVYANDGKMYLESASRAFGVPMQEMIDHQKRTGQHHPLRDKGKRMELGLGFGGWVNALRSPQIRYEGTDEELKEAVLKWRAASPALQQFWGGQRVREGGRWVTHYFGLEGAAVQAVLNPGTIYSYRGIKYLVHDDVLYCRLLSGRRIPYHRPRLQETGLDYRGLALSFEGWNSNPKYGAMGWQRMSTYSGKLAENVVQATACDIQMHAIAQLQRAGYPIVLHTYDEVVAEVPEGFGSIEELEQIMCDVPDWAKGWPIKAAGGWRAKRYRKG